MRTVPAQAAAIIANPAHSAVAYVTVYNAAGTVGTALDSAALGGLRDPVMSVGIEAGIDSHRSATVMLRRQAGLYSLAPLVSTGNPLFGSEPLVDVGRRIVIEAAVMPPDASEPPAGLKLTVFDGWVDEVAWAGDELRLTCADKAAKLRDAWIEVERIYGYCQGTYATKGAVSWRGDLPPLQLGDLVVPSDDRQNGRFYRVTAASSAQSVAEPTWPTGSGATVTSGGVTLKESGVANETGVALETLISQVLADNGLGAYTTLQVPVSPAWMVRPYVQQRQSVLSAIEAMVAQLGWWVRFEWATSTGRFELTIAAPDRASTTVHKTVAVDAEVACEELGVDIWSIRNVVRVVYSASGSRDADGNPVRLVSEASDAASVAKYGRRFMEVAEGDASAIDTSTEAARLRDAILADLSLPEIGLGLTLPVDPYLELGDRIAVPADGLRFSSDQTLAVQSLSHSFEAGGARTRATLRGKPAAAFGRWLGMDCRARPSGIHALAATNSTAVSTTATPIIGGARIQTGRSYLKASRQQQQEVHVSDNASFDPTSDSLVASGVASSVEVARLVPGRTYYAKTVPLFRNASRIVRGPPSEATAFVAGRASAGHIEAHVIPALGPPNSAYASALAGLSDSPPDHWSIKDGKWGDGQDIWYGDGATAGRWLALLSTEDASSIASAGWPWTIGVPRARLTCWLRRSGTAEAGRGLKVSVEGFSDAPLANQTSIETVTVPYDWGTVDTWKQLDVILDVPADSNFVRVILERETAEEGYAWDVGPMVVAPTWGTEWQAMDLDPAWTDVGSPFSPASYRLDDAACCHLRGALDTTDATKAICVLPAAFRPHFEMRFTAVEDDKLAQVIVEVDGTVSVWASHTTGRTYLDGIIYDTRA